MGNGVTSHTSAHIGKPSGPVAPVALIYRRERPWQITLSFRSEVDLDVPWVFARELLALGLHAPIGDGDVHLCPVPPRHVAVELDNGTEGITAYFTAHDLAAFHHATCRVVAPGTESDHTDLDTVCDALRRAA